MPTTRTKMPASPRTSRPSTPRAKAVVFRFPAPDAQRVMLAGDFNGWDPEAQPMKKGRDAVWSATVKLRPGAYQYKLIVDGVWQEDNTNPHRASTPDGIVNSVVEVA